MTIKRQLDFEERCHQEAVTKLKHDLNKAKQKGYFSSADSARQTIKSYTLDLTAQLLDHLNTAAKGRATTTVTVQMAKELLGYFDTFVTPEAITVITLKSLLDTHGGFDDPTIAKVANFLGTRIEDEIRFRFYETTAPEEVVKAAWKRVTEAGSTPGYRRISTKLITEKRLRELDPHAEIWQPWVSSYRINMGLALIEFAMKQGLVVKELKRLGKKSVSYVRLAPHLTQYFDEYFEEMLDLAYFRKPLIEKPLPWVLEDGYSIRNTSGGYHSDKLRTQFPLCRGYAHRSEFGELSIKFLNLLGETAYAIDADMVKLANHLKEQNIKVGTFKYYERMPELDEPMPEHLTKLPTDHPQRVAWRREKKHLYDYHNEMVKKSVRSSRSLQAAEEFLKYPRFYLSWSNDYRGRCYPQQPWLNPQTTEFEKSLIRFAEGCKLDDRGLWWVKQAIGTAYLGSRLNLQDRVNWVDENITDIAVVGLNPAGHIPKWENAKEPFQYVQLCVEYFKVAIAKTQHLWYVPIGVDATSSGLQILSSLLRDEVGMKHSNVLPPAAPDSPPEDAYMLVLEEARRLANLSEDTKYLSEFLVHRSLGKTTMVMLYGAAHGTVRDRVIKAFIDLKQYRNPITFEDANKIASLLEKASANVFPKAFEALKWIAKLAQTAAADKPQEFEWTTPAGDVIRFREFSVPSTPVRLSHLGKVHIPLDSAKTLDYKGMSTALCPSYVHSLDAALLKISFNEWNRPITTIHDCFKCLPSDMDRALGAIRRGFYSVCSGNPLADLQASLKVTQDALETLEQGTGDLKGVFDSTYLFN
jgi:DNA-directed RNA polymerase